MTPSKTKTASKQIGAVYHQRFIANKPGAQRRTKGLTTLIVTHDSKVASLADRILYMKDGMIIDEIIPEKNADKNELIALLNK